MEYDECCAIFLVLFLVLALLATGYLIDIDDAAPNGIIPKPGHLSSEGKGHHAVLSQSLIWPITWWLRGGRRSFWSTTNRKFNLFKLKSVSRLNHGSVNHNSKSVQVLAVVCS